MTGFPGSPRVLKGGLILIDPVSGAVKRVIALQYNPDLLTRSLQPQSVGGTAAYSEPLRLKGPPIETFKLEAEIDATDQLEFPERNPQALQVGVSATLAVLETIVYPDSGALVSNNQLAMAGTLEIVPVQAPLTLFVWGKDRVVPVRVTDFGIVEEAFDPQLNPIRAKISLGMRVLNVNDLGFDDKGGHLYMVYQQRKERLAAQMAPGTLSAFGLGGL